MKHSLINIHSHTPTPASQELILRSAFPWEAKELLQAGFSSLSVGLHPWHVHQVNANNLLQEVNHWAKNSKVLAIGEAGLDRFAEASLEEQIKYFTQQVHIADQAQKPLIVHCVRCYSELIAIKKRLAPSNPWIIHGFRGNSQIAKELIRYGCYLSFGIALMPAESKLSHTFREIPTEKIFLETDESDVPISDIYIRAGQLLKTPQMELQHLLEENFRKCFGFKLEQVQTSVTKK